MQTGSDDKDIVWVSVPLDAATAARLENLADICHAPKTAVAASLLHDVLADDEQAHIPSERAVIFN